MSIAEIQKEISKLSAVEKSKIYGHYLCKMVALKHSFAIMEYAVKSCELSFQDNMQTLKIFI